MFNLKSNNMDQMTKEILKVIAKGLPYTKGDVEYVYERLKSFDKTIQLFHYCMSSGSSIAATLDAITICNEIPNIELDDKAHIAWNEAKPSRYGDDFVIKPYKHRPRGYIDDSESNPLG